MTSPRSTFIQATESVITGLRADPAILVDLTRELVRIPMVNPKFESESAITREAELQRHLRGEAFVDAFAAQDSWLQAHPPHVQWDLHGLHFAPMNAPVDHPLMGAAIDTRSAAGLSTDIRGFVAVCDAAHYAGAGVSGIIHGPGGDGFHGPDEYVDLDSLQVLAETLAATATNWCGVR